MTKAEYVARAEADTEWAPGWLAIDAAFGSLYPDVTPHHLGSPLSSRAMSGGDEYVDGVSLYPSGNGYQHLLTYGMSALYVDEQSFGGEFSGWGYEMTMKVHAGNPSDCWWAINSMRNLARYTYQSQRWLEPHQFVDGRGHPLRSESATRLTSYVTVPDTEVSGVDTVHGRVDFVQLVGITQTEVDWVAGPSPAGAADRVRELVGRMAAAGNRHLVTDLGRTQDFV